MNNMMEVLINKEKASALEEIMHNPCFSESNDGAS
jgi:hypothetical protein